MNGEERRKSIIEILETTETPVPGSTLARQFNVSRQVIVQDVALLRATNKNVMSTNRGYYIYHQEDEKNKVKRVISVRHSDEDMKDELYSIVDAGVRVLDVIIEHEVYGLISVDLYLKSRRDVNEFLENIKKVKSKPLKELTHGIHYHTVEANAIADLDALEIELKEKGFLIS
ncbi:MAG: transcription repressor NadR [Suipraeoptans sp.]